MSKHWNVPPEAVTPRFQRFLDMLYSDGWNPDLKLDPPVYDLDYESDGTWSFDDDDERKWTWCEDEPHNGTEAVLPEGATITQQVDLPDQDVSEQPDADDDDWRGSGVQHSGEADLPKGAAITQQEADLPKGAAITEQEADLPKGATITQGEADLCSKKGKHIDEQAEDLPFANTLPSF